MKLINDLNPISSLANYLILLVDPTCHQNLVNLREKMTRSAPHVKAICAVDASLHTSLGIIANRRSGSHRDTTDMKEGWAVMFVLGSFSGGRLEFKDQGVTASFSPGDAVLLKARDVNHAVRDWSGNIRVTLVYFTKESVWKEYSGT